MVIISNKYQYEVPIRIPAGIPDFTIHKTSIYISNIIKIGY